MELTKLKSSDLVAKSMLIEKSMDGNINFPLPEPTIADITAKRMELETFISRSANGDKEIIAGRKVVYEELLAMLKKLAKYVSYRADGNESIILSSGYGVRNQKTPITQISRPENLRVNRAERQGEIKLRWKTVRGAMIYSVEITSTDPSDPNTKWTRDSSITRITHTINNLTPGTYYWFRVCAIGRKETSAYSNVKLIMAA